MLLDSNAEKTEELIRICGWCKKIDVRRDDWKDLEKAINTLGLFEREKFPLLTHGICDAYYKAMSGMLAIERR